MGTGDICRSKGDGQPRTWGSGRPRWWRSGGGLVEGFGGGGCIEEGKGDSGSLVEFGVSGGINGDGGGIR